MADDDPGYEQARDELAQVVAKLEAGGLSLEDSLALWERGEALARVCERHLAGARAKVDAVLREAESGSDDVRQDGTP
ncbi:exodeoxyribonuclease VII small subunit [Actinomycetospora sp. NBRC 106378]|uniref:exodeoxyribonuclease VII small subunit n=1 Tax=Actinomycetospora sp. NBRC 106378 TaxID=3032208 RepID=UPI0024A51113|nr:exodeoxyribonuclease VII small subunit [Actinomycetospora sp. NBRC 106378]GLZ55191.1 exodeoxyribonuclease 7 small subunit [Actinomycetospora sp. NBRC 106378]